MQPFFEVTDALQKLAKLCGGVPGVFLETHRKIFRTGKTAGFTDLGHGHLGGAQKIHSPVQQRGGKLLGKGHAILFYDQAVNLPLA